MPRRSNRSSARSRQRPQGAPRSATKARMTFHLPVDVIERAKNAVYWTPGLTLADLAARALTRVLDEIERKRGKAFPQRREELRGGRPIK